MKRLTLIAAIAAFVITVPGCETIKSITTASTTKVTTEQIGQARDVSYGLEASYDAALTVAVAWGKQPTCGTPKAPPAPACKTLKGLLAIEQARAPFRSAIDRLNAVIADTTTTSSVLSVAVSAAKQAAAEYQIVAAQNNVKGS